MRIAAVPKGIAPPIGSERVFDLFEKFSGGARGAVGGRIATAVKRARLAPSERAWDFAALAISAVAADEGCPRSDSPDGWTRQIDLTVSVADPNFWTSQSPLIAKMLSFLTGDIWTVAFIPGGKYPTPPRQVSPRKEGLVCLLSGGMDSLVGAIDLVSAGLSPLLVSQVAKGDKKQQQDFARRIAPGSYHLQMNHNARQPGSSERSQRARSMGFFGFAALAATSLAVYANGGRVEVVVPENGYISVNIPLTPLRLGSLSTRTTHPTFLAMLQELFDQASLRIDIRNPYQLKTKGEMLRECQNQQLLETLASVSTSCGRYARTGFQHCGRCVPCLVRRAAFLEWGKIDGTPTYKYRDLGRDDAQHRNFGDVRAASIAVATKDAFGSSRWIGGALHSVPTGNRPALISVAERGIEEIARLLRQQGAI